MQAVRTYPKIARPSGNAPTSAYNMWDHRRVRREGHTVISVTDRRDGRDRRGRGELESEVLATLWAAERPLTPADVQEGLGTPIAYNTVQTILIRLLDKGLVSREKLGRAHTYQPTRGQAELAAERMHAVMGRGKDHVAVLQRFVHGLSAADEQALRHLISADHE
jgi:predicted transcriptional regulator